MDSIDSRIKSVESSIIAINSSIITRIEGIIAILYTYQDSSSSNKRGLIGF